MFIQVKGLPELIGNLNKKTEQIQNEVNDAIHNSGFIMENEIAQSIAGRRDEPTSVDTGRFLNSIKTFNGQKFVSVVYSDVDYSIFLENGTSRINPRHHFGNSLERQKSAITELIKTALTEDLDK